MVSAGAEEPAQHNRQAPFPVLVTQLLYPEVSPQPQAPVGVKSAGWCRGAYGYGAEKGGSTTLVIRAGPAAGALGRTGALSFGLGGTSRYKGEHWTGMTRSGPISGTLSPPLSRPQFPIWLNQEVSHKGSEVPSSPSGPARPSPSLPGLICSGQQPCGQIRHSLHFKAM